MQRKGRLENLNQTFVDENYNVADFKMFFIA